MKAYLSFNLNVSEDKYDYECAMNGHKYRTMLSELLELIRRKDKYPVEGETFDTLREEFYRDIYEDGIEI